MRPCPQGKQHHGPYQTTSSSPEGETGQSACRRREVIATYRAVVDYPGIGEGDGGGGGKAVDPSP